MTEADVQRALSFATQAHGEQRRKYTNDPYIVHPLAVAALVKSRPHTAEMVAASLLHDTIEDTPVTMDTIRFEFGPIVAALVADLTDVSKPSDGNRATRKAIDLAHTALASSEAKTIKLADLIDNTDSITRYDPGFAKIYMREKAALLDVLKDGDGVLWQRANGLVLHHLSRVEPF